jgi:hypothetical protein
MFWLFLNDAFLYLKKKKFRSTAISFQRIIIIIIIIIILILLLIIIITNFNWFVNQWQ